MADENKTVLAALLAVRHGFVSPEQAMQLLAKAQTGDAAGAQQTIVTAAPDSGFEKELEQAAADPAKALTEFGVPADVQQTLMSVNPPEDILRNTLLSVAAGATVQAPTALPQGPRYEVRREHARGGMGRIMIALDRAMGREVALKELLPGGGGSGSPFTPAANTRDAVERFLREARITGRLEHPNIVPVYEIGTREDGSLYYTMKFVRGRSMAAELKRIGLDASLDDAAKLAARLRLLNAFQDLCNAVAYAHARGVIHRDLKPANVMLGDFGETLVLDWGLARLKGEAAEKPSEDAGRPESAALTMAGAVMGTPSYMAPEQARGESALVDEKSDVYALGAVLYEILAGKPPYEGGSGSHVVSQVLAGPPPAASELCPGIPLELEALCETAMQRERASRTVDAKKLADEIGAYRDGRALSMYQYSAGEVVKRFVARHQTAVASIAIAFLVLLGVGIAAFISVTTERDRAMDAEAVAQGEREAAQESARQAEVARKDAEAARKDAEAEAERAKESDRQAQLRYLESRLRDGELLEEQGRWDEARALYTECAMKFEALGASPARANLALAFATGRGPAVVATLGRPLLESFNVNGQAISPSGRYIAAARWEKLLIYDTMAGRWACEVGAEYQGTRAIEFLGEDRIALGSEAGVTIFETEGGTLLARLPELDGAVGICASQDGAVLYVVASGRLVRLNTSDLKVEAAYDIANGEYPRIDAVSPDGDIAVVNVWKDYESSTVVFRPNDSSLVRHTLEADGQRIECACFASASLALLGTDRGEVIAWDCTAGRVHARRKLLDEAIKCMAFDPAEAMTVAAGGSGTAVFCKGLDLAGDGPAPVTIQKDPEMMALQPGVNRLAVGSQSQPWMTYELADGRAVPVIDSHTGSTTGIPVAGGAMVLSGGLDGSVCLWDAISGKILSRVINKHCAPGFPVALSPDEKVGLVMEVQEEDDTFRLTAYRLPTLEQVWEHMARTPRAPVAAFSPDGALVIAPGPTGRPVLLRAVDGLRVRELDWPFESSPDALRFDLSGKNCGAACRDGVRLYDTATGAITMQTDFNAKDRHLRDFYDFSPDLKFGLGATRVDGDGGDGIFDLATGTVVLQIEISGWGDGALWLSGRRVLLINAAGNQLRVVDWGNAANNATISLDAPDGQSHVNRPGLDSAGEVCVVGGSSGRLLVIHLGSRKPIRDAAAVTGSALIATSPDCALAVSCFTDGEAWLWEVATGRAIATLEGAPSACVAAALSNEARRLVTGDAQGGLVCWDAATATAISSADAGSRIRSIELVPGNASIMVIDDACKFSEWSLPGLTCLRSATLMDESNFSAKLYPGLGLALIVRFGGEADVFSLESYEQVFEYPAPRVWWQGADISSDGKLLALYSGEGSLEIWDLASRTRLDTDRARSTLFQIHGSLIFVDMNRLLLCFEPDTNRLLLRDVQTGKTLRRFDVDCDSPEELRVSNDGSIVIVGTREHGPVAYRAMRDLPVVAASFAARRWWSLANAAMMREPGLESGIKGDIALMNGRHAEASRHYESAGDRPGVPVALVRASAAAALRQQAEQLITRKQFARALFLLDQSLSLRKSAGAYWARAEAFEALNDQAMTIESLEHALATGLPLPDARLRLASLYYEAGRDADVLPLVNTLIENSADNAEQALAYYLRASVRLRTGLIEEGTLDMYEANARGGGHDWRLKLARAYVARAAVREGERREDDLGRAQLQMIRIVECTDDHDKAFLEDPVFEPLRTRESFQRHWDAALAERKKRDAAPSNVGYAMPRPVEPG